MSSPETICCSLETAKKLKEAGYKKDTVFVWAKYVEPDCPKYNRDEPILCLRDDMPYEEYGHYEIVCPAYTSSEIELPNNIVDEKGCAAWMVVNKQHTCHAVELDNGVTLLHKAEGNTEVEVKAQMWLYLKEKGLI